MPVWRVGTFVRWSVAEQPSQALNDVVAPARRAERLGQPVAVSHVAPLTAGHERRIIARMEAGRVFGIVGYVWECGDDECGCSQAVIEGLHHNARDRRWIVRSRLWTGPFYTDHEGGADADLAAMREAVAATWPEAEQAIAWGWMTQTESFFRALAA